MVLINIIVSVLASKFIGLPGLALGTTLAAYFGAITLYMRLKKKIGKFTSLNHFKKENFKLMLASIIMGIIAYFTYYFVSIYLSSTISLLISISIAAIVYLGLLLILKVEELFSLLNSFRRKVKKD